MDFESYSKYSDVEINKQVDAAQKIVWDIRIIMMFAEIIVNDDALFQSLRYISKRTANATDLTVGVLAKDLSSQIILERRVQVRKGKIKEFVKREAHIDQKHAERTLDKLTVMGMCYHRSIGKYKTYYVTKVGYEVIRFAIANRDKFEKGVV